VYESTLLSAQVSTASPTEPSRCLHPEPWITIPPHPHTPLRSPGRSCLDRVRCRYRRAVAALWGVERGGSAGGNPILLHAARARSADGRHVSCPVAMRTRAAAMDRWVSHRGQLPCDDMRLGAPVGRCEDAEGVDADGFVLDTLVQVPERLLRLGHHRSCCVKPSITGGPTFAFPTPPIQGRGGGSSGKELGRRRSKQAIISC
jgi:hypothetical protein